MKTIKFEVAELTCPGCSAKIEGVLLKQKGVDDAKVFFSAGKVKIRFRDWLISASELANLIENIGYPIMTAKRSAL